MKDLLSPLLCALGLPALFRFVHRRRLLVLTYHGVVPEPLEAFCWHQLPLEKFRRQIAWLAKRYTVLPVEEALERLAAGTLPRRALSLTFDDGLRNNLTTALPVLREAGVTATLYTATAPLMDGRPLWPCRLWLAMIGTKATSLDATALGLGSLPLPDAEARSRAYIRVVERLKALPRSEKECRFDAILEAVGEPLTYGDFSMLSEAEAREILASGVMDLAAHTVHHEILSRCEDDVVRTEIAASQEHVTRLRGRAPKTFAYPNGGPKDFDERSRAAVSGCGIPWALSTLEGFNDAGTDPLAVRRFSVGAELSFSRFCLVVSGAAYTIGGWRRRLRERFAKTTSPSSASSDLTGRSAP